MTEGRIALGVSESFSYLSSGVIEIPSFLDDVELKVAGVKGIAFQERNREEEVAYTRTSIHLSTDLNFHLTNI